MMDLEQQPDLEDQGIRLLKEWLPRIDGECRAYIKGASQALLYVQEGYASGLLPEMNKIKLAKPAPGAERRKS